MKNIFLIGFMGTGKSIVGTYLQRTYAMQLLEMDYLIEQEQHMCISDIFEQYGETYFRDLETTLLKRIQKKDNQVVSCGGGVPMRDENVKEMKKNGTVVLLTATPETILKRVQDDENRPLLKGRKTVEGIAELMEKRHARYVAAADFVVETDGKEPSQIAEDIIRKMGEALC